MSKIYCKYCKEQFDAENPSEEFISHATTCLWDNCFFEVEEEDA